ncbi:MAG TPA: cytochrome c3 family protein [Tepidisphaeraceae bacterium]
MPARTSTTWKRRSVAAVVSLGVLLLLIGCSAGRRYQVLSFFFDGVPDPNAPRIKGTATGTAQVGAGARVFSIHPPYRDGNCAGCHGSGDEKLLNPGQELCLSCHKNIRTAHEFMHGPVSAGACLWCHDPHQSSQAALLKAAAPQLCFQCHERQFLTRKVPEHAVKEKSCLDCHVGHGSSRPYLIRAAAPTTQNAMLPTTVPAGAAR